MKICPNEDRYAIHCHSQLGPTFGPDITIFNYANTSNTSSDGYSNLGYSYSHPQYAQGTNEAKTFLSGSYGFQLDEIEVYQKD